MYVCMYHPLEIEVFHIKNLLCSKLKPKLSSVMWEMRRNSEPLLAI